MIDRALVVWWDRNVVGLLTQDRSGDLSFGYDPAWVSGDNRPLSRSLPLRDESFNRAACRPFFGGLLPEADQRQGAAAALGVSVANDFALLDRLGGDVAGAIMLLPPGQNPPERSTTGAPRVLSNGALADILARLPGRPLLAGEDGLRLSLAGAQAKIPVVLVEGNPALPAPGQPTTHIIKPEIERFAGSVQNEAWCMTLAARVGLPTAHAEARQAEGHPYLLVERYDRVITEGGITLRLHQEDACQALGVPPERKYAAEGGPAFRDLFALTRGYVRVPALAVLNLVDVAIFNLVIGNADAHGKNFSFVLDDRGPRLAPFYDLLSTIQWPALASRMAMRLGSAGTIDEVTKDTWKAFAESAGITYPLLRQRIARVTTSIISAIDTMSSDTAVGEALAKMVMLRADRVRYSVA
jgi:serine/threonine-protein kinase HipA